MVGSLDYIGVFFYTCFLDNIAGKNTGICKLVRDREVDCFIRFCFGFDNCCNILFLIDKILYRIDPEILILGNRHIGRECPVETVFTLESIVTWLQAVAICYPIDVHVVKSFMKHVVTGTVIGDLAESLR